jgi:Lrp/AsnC family leucine-responsive transcriptional regulator
MQLDETDIRILSVLQGNARITNQELAERVNISPSPCLRRVRKLEENRVIKRYVALLDPEAVGQSLQAFIEIRLEHQNPASVARFEAEVQKFVEVQESYLMTGEWDFILRVVVSDLQGLQSFHMRKLSKIAGISNLRTSICLKQAKFSTELDLARR